MSISFHDPYVTILADRSIEVNVHRKSTNTNKYLSFLSHNPAQSKRAIVKTLFDRGKNSPSTDSNKKLEKDRVIQELELNGYSKSLLILANKVPRIRFLVVMINAISKDSLLFHILKVL